MKKQKLYIDTGDKYLTVNSNISKRQLMQILSDNFVPYIECFRKCGRAEICKLTEKLKRQNEDQKCGVIENILENYLDSTFNIFKKCNFEGKQKYLGATTKFVELAIDLESYLGAISCKDIMEFYGDISPSLFGGLLRNRKAMEEIARLFKDIKVFRAEIPVCLVEGIGDAELFRIFTRFVRVSNYDKLKNIDIIYGKDNRKKGRLDLLIKNKIKRNERTIIILDGDGSKKNILESKSLKKLWQQKLIRKKDIFVFHHNIELSFPPEILFVAVKQYMEHFKIRKKLNQVEILKTIRQKGDFIKNCKQQLGISINKIIFDRILGHLLADVAYGNFREIMERRPRFYKYDIFRFLEFIVKC